MSETGRLLRGARLRCGWSQSELARHSGVSQSVISAYESGAREPSVAALRRLGRSMGFDVAFVSAKKSHGPDPSVMARQLEDVLGLVDAMHFRAPERPLRYPVLARRS